MQIISTSRRSLTGMLLMLFAAAWISLLLWDNLGQLSNSFSSLKLFPMALSVIPAVLTVFITAYVYFLILSGIVPSAASIHNIMMPFIASQVVRYLPGRVWGILYQIQVRDNSVKIHSIVKANIVQFVLFSFNSIAVSVSAYVYYYKGIAVGLITFATLASLVFLVIRTSLLQRIASLITRNARSEEQPQHVGNRNLLIFVLLQLEWFLYLMACILMLPRHFNFTDALMIASNYVVAWIVGIVATVLPSGLMVREASFMWLSSRFFNFNPADMFAFSIVARILFTLADIVAASLSFALVGTGSGVRKG